jgi:RNA polymerase sigma-70 factor, ECF subfamily
MALLTPLSGESLRSNNVLIGRKSLGESVLSSFGPLTRRQEDDDCEARWIEAAQANPSAFEPLYRRYYTHIYHYLRMRINNDEDAADLTHQVFYQAIRALPRYKQQGVPFVVWLYRIAHRAAINASTRRLPIVSWDALPETMHPSTELNVEERVVHAEALSDLRALLQELDPFKRELLALRFAAGLTIPEIAAVVGKSQNAIKKQFSRIIRVLKEHYSHEQ